MVVLLRVPRALQDAGLVRPLAVGQVCEVPEVLAQQWIARGLAVEVTALAAAPENKAASPRKRTRR